MFLFLFNTFKIEKSKKTIEILILTLSTIIQ